MRQVLLLALICGVAGFFGALGVMHGKASVEAEHRMWSQPTDLTWQAYEPPVRQVEPPIELTIIDTDEVLEFEDLDRFCMAKNIYHEARSEDLLGQLAVAQVTLNRVESENYPNTICEVVMQPWQFSWANRHKDRWAKPKGRLWEASKALANQFLDNGVRVDGLRTALFYHADYVDPKWRDDEFFVAQVGAHLFYENARNL